MWSPVCDVFKEESEENLMSKKLYLVKSLGYSEDRSILIVAESPEEAEKKMYIQEEGQVYGVFAKEVSNVDGYNIVLVPKDEETPIPDLLPCPFCGNTEKGDLHVTVKVEDGRKTYGIWCETCGAELTKGFGFETILEAIQAWNTRVGENNE